jgi:hypothetical protein
VPDANDNLATVRKFLGHTATIAAAMCGSAYVIITLSGATRTQALYITGVLFAALVGTAYIDSKGDD